MSVFSVNSEFMSQKFLSSFCYSQQAQGFVTRLRQFEQGRGRQFFQLEVGGFSELKKLQQIGQSFPSVAIGRFRFTSLSNASLQDLKGGIDFALFSLVGDDPEHVENVFHRLEMIAPVTENMNDAHNAPVLQFVEAIADVGASDAESGGDLLRRHWPRGKEKEGVDLGDGAIDPPARPHFAPMEDELLRHRRERFHIFHYFCLNRN